jgi:hypothetical protein
MRGFRFQNQDSISAILTGAAFPDLRRTLRVYYIETVMNLPDFRLAAAAKIISAIFWNVTHLRMAFTDVSGQHIGPIFKGQVLPDL